MFKRNYPGVALGVLLFISFGLFADAALASDATAGGSGLPWETSLQMLRQSISGPFALSLALIGIVVTGGQLIFGGEISTFGRAIIYLVMVLALIVFANRIITSALFSGATIPDGVVIVDQGKSGE